MATKKQFTSPHKSPKVSRKNNVPIIIGLLILAIIAAIGIFFWKNTQSSIRTEVPPSKSPSKPYGHVYYQSFINNLRNCTKSSNPYEPLWGGIVERIIHGEENGKCYVEEKLGFNMTTHCKYSEKVRNEVADYFEKMGNAKSVELNTAVGMEYGKAYVKDKIDGVIFINPVASATIDGACSSTE